MASITFDRLKYVEALKASGVPQGQARAHADALAQAPADTPDVASKSDIAEVKALIAETKSDILKWMFGGRDGRDRCLAEAAAVASAPYPPVAVAPGPSLSREGRGEDGARSLSPCGRGMG